MLKNIFACLFSVQNTISLSRHEQVCLMRHVSRDTSNTIRTALQERLISQLIILL